MPFFRQSVGITGLILCVGALASQAAEPTQKKRIVLIAGETAKVDVVGHHDYLAGHLVSDFSHQR